MLGKLKDIGAKVQTGIETAATQSTKMIANARGIDQSTDETFEGQRKKFDSYLTTMEQMYENIKKHLSGIKNMTEGLCAYSQGIAFFSGEEKKIAGSDDFVLQCESFKAAAEAYRTSVGQMEINLKQKIELLNLLRREVNERDRLLLSYDQVRHELALEQKKPAPNATTINLIQTRLTAAKTLYEKRNEDVTRQIGEAYAARDIQFEFYELVQGLGVFLTSGQSFVELGKKGASVQRTVQPTQAKPLPSQSQSQGQAYSSLPQPPVPAAQPLPPRPASAQKRARALYPFNAQQPNELSLKPGDIIFITNQAHPDWWQGSLNGAVGDFPSNYVEVLP
eukprot:TRINITY_DN275_c0_g1_i1.p1 TRINITY_DN275_c0_g1~~TRINITY_DN275_c0_g1_i1.p1  ORF type:complete len:336 (+),score=71.24 TRINITY_DN275_c0_g1_i1:67-1074(+)